MQRSTPLYKTKTCCGAFQDLGQFRNCFCVYLASPGSVEVDFYGFGIGECRTCYFTDLAFGGVEMRLVALPWAPPGFHRDSFCAPMCPTYLVAATLRFPRNSRPLASLSHTCTPITIRESRRPNADYFGRSGPCNPLAKSQIPEITQELLGQAHVHNT